MQILFLSMLYPLLAMPDLIYIKAYNRLSGYSLELKNNANQSAVPFVDDSLQRVTQF